MRSSSRPWPPERSSRYQAATRMGCEPGERREAAICAEGSSWSIEKFGCFGGAIGSSKAMAPRARTESWTDTLTGCINDVVIMRPENPLEVIGRLLADSSARPNWKETAAAYAKRHDIHNRLAIGLDQAGINPVRLRRRTSWPCSPPRCSARPERPLPTRRRPRRRRSWRRSRRRWASWSPRRPREAQSCARRRAPTVRRSSC